MRDRLGEGDDRADQDHEHDGVAYLHAGVELFERVDDRLGEDLAVEQAAGLGDAVRDGGGGPRVEGCAAADGFR